jgi:hypothetical protein
MVTDIIMGKIWTNILTKLMHRINLFMYLDWINKLTNKVLFRYDVINHKGEGPYG